MSQEKLEKRKENFENFLKHYNSFKLSDKSKNSLEKRTKSFESLAQLFVWGEKNDQIFSDAFMEHNILNQYLNLLSICNASKSERQQIISLINSYSYLVANSKKPEIVSYLFSHPTFNAFIKFPFDFKDDEIIYYYVNFVKALSQRFHSFPIQIFYNQV